MSTGNGQQYAPGTDEEREFVAGAVQVSKGLKEKAFTWQGRWPRESVEFLADHGFLGVSLPEEYGGGGQDLLFAALLVEVVAQVCPDTAHAVRFTNFGPAQLIARMGNTELKERCLPSITAGKSVAARAVSEPEAGSDWGSITTTATPDGSNLIINGYKIFASEANVSDVYVVLARFPDGKIDSVAVERDRPGFNYAGEDINMYGGSQGHLSFEDCVVPASNRLGEGGLTEQQSLYNWARLGCAVVDVGLARSAIDIALEHTQVREQFGSKLCDFQGVQWMMADSVVAWHAAREITYRALRKAAGGHRTSDLEAAMSKLTASEASRRIVDDCLQVLGGSGYMRGHPLEFIYRFIRGGRIAGGNDQVLRNVIAGEVYAGGMAELLV